MSLFWCLNDTWSLVGLMVTLRCLARVLVGRGMAMLISCIVCVHLYPCRGEDPPFPTGICLLSSLSRIEDDSLDGLGLGLDLMTGSFFFCGGGVCHLLLLLLLRFVWFRRVGVRGGDRIRRRSGARL